VWNYYPKGVPQATAPCGSFWWRDIMKLVDNYRNICSTVTGKGDSVLFWSGNWNGLVPAKEFPHLHYFALDNLLSVQEVISREDKATLFYRPMS
jgi:hypothetical protein